MNPNEKQNTIERYSERLRRLGPVVEALGWRDEAQQRLRFDVIGGMLGQLDGASVLDIGCGFGDFYEYLTSRGAAPHYVGCDISPDVLQIARSRFPRVQFDLRDILQEPYAEQSFDYICISGIFNHCLEDNEGFLNSMLSNAYRSCERGVAANMMTDQVDYKDKHLYYFNPERVLRLCRNLSRRVALRHDYPLHEFTVFIGRESAGVHSPDKKEGG